MGSSSSSQSFFIPTTSKAKNMNQQKDTFLYIIEGSLEGQLPTIWTVEKQISEVKSEERRSTRE